MNLVELWVKQRKENKKYIESDAFYTDCAGYKLKVLFYPNGSKFGMNTYVSVYIVVMKGKYDAILP